MPDRKSTRLHSRHRDLPSFPTRRSSDLSERQHADGSRSGSHSGSDRPRSRETLRSRHRDRSCQIGRAHVCTPVTAIYPLSLHDALQIYQKGSTLMAPDQARTPVLTARGLVKRYGRVTAIDHARSEEHTSALPSPRSTLFPYTTLFRSIRKAAR